MNKSIYIFLILLLMGCGQSGSGNLNNPTGPDIPIDDIIPVGVISVDITDFNLAINYYDVKDTGIRFWGTFKNTGNIDLNNLTYEFAGLTCIASPDVWVPAIFESKGGININAGSFYNTPYPGLLGTSHDYAGCYLKSGAMFEVTFRVKDSGGDILDSQTKTIYRP